MKRPTLPLIIQLALAWASAAPATLWAADEAIAVADSIKKYRFLASDTRKKNDHATAARYYRQLLKYQPQDRLSHYYLGKVLYAQQQYDQAEAAFAAAVNLDSLHVNSNLMLYQTLAQLSNSDTTGRADSAAAASLERVLKAKPKHKAGETRRILADLYRRSERLPEALTHYEKLAAANDDAKLIEMVAGLHASLGQNDQALAWRQRLLDSAGSGSSADQVRAMESLANLKAETGDYVGAYEGLMQLAQLDATNRYSHYSRAASLAEGRRDQGRRLNALKGMAQANPRDLETVATLAEHYLSNGDSKTATIWIDRGLAIDSHHGHLQVLRGDCLKSVGAEEEAVAAYELAKADPAWESVAQQRIWQINPPETEEERLKREFFGKGKEAN